jgi:hypothetical protein
MFRLGQKLYPERPFAASDATALPLRTASCDILLSGTVLMHVIDIDLRCARAAASPVDGAFFTPSRLLIPPPTADV